MNHFPGLQYFTALTLCKMKSTPAMSKQSDGCCREFISTSANKLRKLCVLGGLKYVFDGSAPYTTYTDWLEQD